MEIDMERLLPLLALVLYTGAQANADIIHVQQRVDLGFVAASAMISGSIGHTGNTFGSYTFEALAFIGPNLGLIINGNTVASILTSDLGSENPGTFGFNFPLGGSAGSLGSQSASGFSVDGLGTVQIPSAIYTVASLEFGNTPIIGPPVGNQIPNLNVLDPASFLNKFRAAGLIPNPLPGPVIDGSVSPVSSSLTLNLGSNITSAPQGADTIITTTIYMGEVPNTAYQVSSDFGAVNPVPEPGTGPMLGVGLLAVQWMLARMAKRKSSVKFRSSVG